ncbi:MAG: hypothetical protein K0Q62_1516 [Phenylobacterium sp.]|nr:hypothetical protein [Phenylobacterium sp.]
MMKSILAAAAALALGLGASSASAATYLIQFDDTPGSLIGTSYKDGALFQTTNAGSAGYDAFFGLLGGAFLASGLDIKINFYEPAGLVPSDTWRMFGLAGNPVFELEVHTDTNGVAPTPLAGGSSVLETGDWPAFTVNNGDQYTFQFRSDPGSVVPEPATWGLMILGFGGVGAVLRRTRRRLQPA